MTPQLGPEMDPKTRLAGGPSGGTGREEFRRAFSLPLWAGVELTEPLPQIAAYVTNHFGCRESTPDRRALGGQSGDPIHDGGPNLRIKN